MHFNKIQKSIILTSFLLIVILLGVTIAFGTPIKMFTLETTYNYTQSKRSLYSLCINLIKTSYYEKNIEYIPRLGNFKEFDDNMKKFDFSQDTNINSQIYDELLSTYLSSYLYLEDYTNFKKEYLNYHNKFINSANNYGYFGELVNFNKFSEKQLNVLLEVLVLEDLKNNQELNADFNNILDHINNLQSQSEIQRKLGNIEESKILDSKIQSIIEDSKNKK